MMSTSLVGNKAKSNMCATLRSFHSLWLLMISSQKCTQEENGRHQVVFTQAKTGALNSLACQYSDILRDGSKLGPGNTFLFFQNTGVHHLDTRAEIASALKWPEWPGEAKGLLPCVETQGHLNLLRYTLNK